MGAFGQIGYSQTNLLIQPSDSIWGDCPSRDLMGGEQGYLSFQEFKAGLPLTTAPNWAIDSGAFTYNTNYDSVVSMTSGGSDQDDIAVATRPLGPITPGSGEKLWMEAVVSSAVITLARGVFVGVVNKPALASKFLISAVSATKNSNTIGTSAGGQSGYGFWLYGSNLTNFDAVWFNNLQSATGATDLEATTATASGLVLANVLTSPASNPNPGNVNYVPTTPPGILIATLTGTAAQGDLDTQNPASVPQVGLPNSATGATGFVKLGLRYDGQQYLYFYVNGTPVAKMLISSAQDITSDFGAVVQLMSGTAAAKVENLAWFRGAALRNP